MTLYASLYAQNLLGYSPIQAGFSALAMIVPLMIAAQLAGRWYDRSGARPPLLLGLTLATIGARCLDAGAARHLLPIQDARHGPRRLRTRAGVLPDQHRRVQPSNARQAPASVRASSRPCANSAAPSASR